MGVTTPIVGLSSDTFPSDVDAFIKAGADDFTSKVTLTLLSFTLVEGTLSH